ncbi:hypothetical protein GJAV_G00122950 [Gymnothorax javanicus]|nr:hypothetical protein GJAV_G00122950 [Gymnothorax javanicus]
MAHTPGIKCWLVMHAFILLLYIVLHPSTGLSETHSLIGTYTAVNGDEFTAVLWLDGEEVDSYSSSGPVRVPRRNWMSEGISRYLWMSVKHHNMLQWDRGRTDILRSDRRLYTSGAAVLQGRFGCEIQRSPDSDIRVTGTFAQYGLNGEDFLSFSLIRHKWESSAEPAVPITREWNRDPKIIQDTEEYIESICLNQLKEVLSFDAMEIPTNSSPMVAVFAKRSSNTTKVTLTCLVTGFRSRNTTVEVYRDEDILTEEDGLSSSGIRPNGDGTRQLRMSLDISTRTSASYSCEAHFGSQRKFAKWDGVIWNMPKSRQDSNMRRHHWILAVPLVFFICLLAAVYRCAYRQQRLRILLHDVDVEAQGPKFGENEKAGRE